MTDNKDNNDLSKLSNYELVLEIANRYISMRGSYIIDRKLHLTASMKFDESIRETVRRLKENTKEEEEAND